MTPLNKRNKDILDILAARGYVAIEEMVAEFEVTPQTIRRDLQELSKKGLLRRHHGGASPNSSTANADYALRHVETATEKARIGKVAAELVTPGASLFLTPGTTVEAVAKAIAERMPAALRVITNSTAAAAMLESCPGISIQITGGIWQRQNRATAGALAAEIVARYRADLLITGIGAIDPGGCLLEYRDEEVIVARAMFDNARKKILVADHAKFTRVATCKLAELRDLTLLITDRKPTPAAARLIRDAGCEVMIAK